MLGGSQMRFERVARQIGSAVQNPFYRGRFSLRWYLRERLQSLEKIF